MNKNKDNILSHTLITGAKGMVGSYVDFGMKMDHRSLDITDLGDALNVCRKLKPKVILHLAAETDVERCERDPQYAYFVNSIGTYNMCVAAKDVGAKFIYISTSAVFDGTKKESYNESDTPDPQNYYGRSKFLGEVIVKSVLEDYIIARVAWMFGGGKDIDQKFVAKMITQMTKDEVKVIQGLSGSPTYGKDLIEALKKLICDGKKGIFHLSNSGKASRFDIVSEIARITNSKPQITEVDPSYFGVTKKIGNNESMASKVKLMRSWQEALEEYIKKEWPDYINK
jgi:dTDP-4-dehydrorhamnose reductase